MRARALQAQDVLRGTGSITPEREAYLEQMRQQLSLPEDKAKKIIREVGGGRAMRAAARVKSGTARARGLVCCPAARHAAGSGAAQPPGPTCWRLRALPHPECLPGWRRRAPQIRTEMVGASAALEESGGEKWTIARVLEEDGKGTDLKKVRPGRPAAGGRGRAACRGGHKPACNAADLCLRVWPPRCCALTARARAFPDPPAAVPAGAGGAGAPRAAAAGDE